MRGGLRGLWRRAVAPVEGFGALAAAPGRWPAAFGWLLALRAPVALAEGVLAYWGFARTYAAFAGMKGPVWDLLRVALPPGLDLEDLRTFLLGLPALPPLARVLPWLLLAAPLYVASLWLHDAVWDHGCLWLLGGLKTGRGFRTTLVAEAEALQAGVFGAVLGLSTSLPGIGWLLSIPVALAGAYFWLLRGVALAAFHGCPAWKGLVATLLHLALACLFLLGALVLLGLAVAAAL